MQLEASGYVGVWKLAEDAVRSPHAVGDDLGTLKQTYLVAIRLIERLHRRFLDVLKAELDRLGIEDINNVQAVLLSNIASENLTIGELTNRGYYMGSNVSYNVKKLVENGYLLQ